MSDGTSHKPLSEWPRSTLDHHKQMLRRKRAEIQGRIDAIDMVLEERGP